MVIHRGAAHEGGRPATSACVRPVSSRSFAGSLKNIWQETAKTSSSVKPSSRGCKEAGLDAHIAVEKHDDVVLRGAEAAFEPPPKPKFVCSQYAHMRGMLS